MSEAPGRAAVILDRDGVLNVDYGYVGDWARFEWVPGAREAVARLNGLGLLVIVATNQSGIGRGYYDEAAMQAVHAGMTADLARAGAHIDGLYACPFHPEAVEARYRHPDHPDRKPNPGMILRALADFSVTPNRALLIGDKATDLEAARRAGVRGVLFDGGNLDAFVAGLELPT
jgi:D-glycero-D-manno-heptose 1,7-bisphosphate phosphatase